MNSFPFYASPDLLVKAPEYRRLKLSSWELMTGYYTMFGVAWNLHCSTPLRNALLAAGPDGSVKAIISFQNHIDGSRHAVAQIPLSTMNRLKGQPNE